MSGMDDFYADAQLGRERNRHAAQIIELERTYQAVIDKTARERDQIIETLRNSNSGNLAVRYALATELAKFDPEHPLIVDSDLRDRIVKVAQDTMAATDDWDQVREVGRTFKIPGSPGAAKIVGMADNYDKLYGQSAGNLALRYSFAGALAKVAPDHPLVRDGALRDRIAKHGADTIRATKDWDQVREVGATFGIPGG